MSDNPSPGERRRHPQRKRLEEDYQDLISDGEFSDLGGFTDDLDIDLAEAPPWKKH